MKLKNAKMLAAIIRRGDFDLKWSEGFKESN